MARQQFDSRNKNILIYVDGNLVPRDRPALSAFDSGFLHGKQFWSSPRLIGGRLFRLSDHLDKIRHSAELVGCPRIPNDEAFINAIRQTLQANNMFDGVHVRVMMTAGIQATASMDIASVCDWDGNPSPPTIVIIPEYRGLVYPQTGVILVTSPFRRPDPEFGNQHSHDNNQNHSSRACSDAKARGANAAVMFDAKGFVAEAHASHIGMIVNGRLLTPTIRCCPPGVTRRVLLELCARHGIEAEEADISASELASADEIFLMGTMSGPVPAIALDGRPIGDGSPGPLTERLKTLYALALTDPSQSFDIFA